MLRSRLGKILLLHFFVIFIELNHFRHPLLPIDLRLSTFLCIVYYCQFNNLQYMLYTSLSLYKFSM